MLTPKPYPNTKELKPSQEGYPSIYYIETVMACNLRCPECAIGSNATNRKREMLTRAKFDEIWRKVKPHAKLVYLHKWGEPTMNSDLPYYIEKVSHSAHSHIMTNGLLLNEEKIKGMLNAGLGTLIFSLDGVTQEVYEKYRVQGDCELAWSNLKLAKRLIDESGFKTDLIAQFIVFKHNEHELSFFKKKCENIGVRFHIRTAYIRFGSVDIPTQPTHRRKIYDNPEDHQYAIKNCPFWSKVLTITVDGSNLLCSQDYDQQYKHGNLADPNTSLDDLWNNPDFVRLRNQIKSGSIPEICSSKCTIYPKSY